MGSSPLTRGKHNLVPALRDGQGLIPAHAGKTPPWIRRARASRAHPRSRGENDRGAHMAVAATGSSPLTRGKHITGALGVISGGLIPAHAGKTTGCDGGG